VFSEYCGGITGAIAVLVLVGASLIVSNTIKLTVFARRKEIEIMKLVGATDSFILFPFVLEGIIIGFLGLALQRQSYTPDTRELLNGFPQLRHSCRLLRTPAALALRS